MANETDELATLRARLDEAQDSADMHFDRAERAEADRDALRAENARLKAVIEGAADAFQSGNDFEAEQIVRVGAKNLARTEAKNG